MNNSVYPRRSLETIRKGQCSEAHFSVTAKELAAFIKACGDRHPLHTNPRFARQRGYKDVIVHGMCVVARCSSFFANKFVGSHGLFVNINADFRLPVFVDDPLVWRAQVVRVKLNSRTIEAKWHVSNASGQIIQKGTGCAWFPKE